MKNKIFFIILFCFQFSVKAQTRKPNIIFILADDQRMQGTIHALGGNEIITPNIDKLAKNGTAFTNAYIMGGNQPAVCSPSRNMIMTGRNLFSIGEKGNVIRRDYAVIGETLGKNGYLTYVIGKWHNDKASLNRSFQDGDEIFIGGMSEQFYKPLFYYDSSGLYNKKISVFGKKDSLAADHLYPDKHSSEIFAENAVKFIKNSNDRKPFFLYISFTAPHDPRDMPEQYKAMYDTSRIALPLNFMQKHPFDNGELNIRDELLTGFPRTPSEIKMHIRDYYAMITHLDDQIGKIIYVLKEKGIYENTIIVFAGDNGLALGQHGLMGKQSVYEHSVKVPLIFSGKNIPKGILNTKFAYLFDIFPTICDLTGIAVPSTVQGQMLLGKNVQNRTTMYYAYRDFQRAVRKGDWKMIVYNVRGKKSIQLFNLKNDPWEMNNLVNVPIYKPKLKEMKEELTDQKKINNDN